ncbi:MAG: DNA repair protein RecO [Alphaproteobacteria bacterium]|nr:DNA repair protein RecO [Alphaproteobacteria bacterium]
MEWTSDAFVLGCRRHGEADAVVSLLTATHGRHLGLVRGGGGRRGRSLFQPGNRIRATWRARLSEHLGQITAEPITAHAAFLFDDPARLAALGSATALLDAALPEREPHPGLFDATAALLAALAATEGWGADYVRWELALLQDLGYGLDLMSCAATGRNDDLTFVSPRTGRAVSRAAGEPYQDRLLPLPRFLFTPDEPPDPRQIVAGLALTGYFLERHLFTAGERHLPSARLRLVERLSR